MAFTLQNLCRATAGANEPITTLASGTIVGCFKGFNYYSPVTDSQATISASGYFDDIAPEIVTGDYMNVFSVNDGTYITYILTNTSNVITSTVALGNHLTSSVALTNVEFAALFTTSIELLPAPGANRMYILDYVEVQMTYGTAVFTNGGPFHVQYGDTAAGLGAIASTETAAATINAVAATSTWIEPQGPTVPAVPANLVNLGLYVAVRTANFTPGASTSTFIINTSARIVATA